MIQRVQRLKDLAVEDPSADGVTFVTVWCVDECEVAEDGRLLFLREVESQTIRRRILAPEFPSVAEDADECVVVLDGS